MKPIATYYEQHAESMTMIDELKPLLTMERLSVDPIAKAAHGMMCQLGKKVQEHSADENHSLLGRGGLCSARHIGEAAISDRLCRFDTRTLCAIVDKPAILGKEL